MTDFEPTPDEKVWYRSRHTGELGHIVRRDGKEYIRVNVPSDENLRLFKPDDWIREQAPSKMTLHAAAKVAFEADKAFCYALGYYKLGRREWLNIGEEARLRWTEKGPISLDPEMGKMRLELYLLIMAGLKKYTI